MKLTVVVVLGHLFCSVPYVFIQLYTVWGNPTPEDSEFLPRYGICVQFLKRYSNWSEIILAPNEVISKVDYPCLTIAWSHSYPPAITIWF